MMGFDRTDDYQPLTYIKGRPLYVTTLLVILHVVALIAACFSQAFNVPEAVVRSVGAQSAILSGFESLFGFSSVDVLGRWKLWQPLTYAFVHAPDLWFLLDMFFLYVWGREVEKYFGRRVFVALYVSLLLTTPALLAAVHLASGAPQFYANSDVLHFAVFIAFVTVYPNVQFFFGLLAKWIAFAFLAIWTLADLSGHHLTHLLILWSSVTVAYLGSRYAGAGGDSFSILGNLRERFPRRAVPTGVRPRLKPRRTSLESGAGSMGDVHESIDPLLDKISKHGLASLTHGERAILERARVSLLRKERGG